MICVSRFLNARIISTNADAVLNIYLKDYPKERCSGSNKYQRKSSSNLPAEDFSRLFERIPHKFRNCLSRQRLSAKEIIKQCPKL